jgi:hypothetical protein
MHNMIRLRLLPIICVAALALKSVPSRAAPDVSFADLATGRAAIVDDPAYFDHLQPMEMETKTGRAIEANTIEEKRAECRRRYQAAVKEFTPDEQTALRDAAAAVDSLVRKDYPLFADTPWNFLKVASNLEGGFPHTRGKHIVFAEHICRGIAAQARAGRERSIGTTELLLHEQMHVVQRANSELFDSLYTGQWGFIRAKSIKTCPWIVEHQLINPDAVDCSWVFPIHRGDETRYIWPLCSLSDRPGPKRMAGDFSMFAFYVVPDGDGYRAECGDGGRPKYSDLLSVRDYCRVLSPSKNIYHPHEASADLFAKLVLFDANGSRKTGAARAADEKTFAPLREWFKKNFAKAK